MYVYIKLICNFALCFLSSLIFKPRLESSDSDEKDALYDLDTPWAALLRI
jgi:hypothetical protein